MQEESNSYEDIIDLYSSWEDNISGWSINTIWSNLHNQFASFPILLHHQHTILDPFMLQISVQDFWVLCLISENTSPSRPSNWSRMVCVIREYNVLLDI